MNKRLHAWTLQGYDLRAFGGPIDLDHGSYRDDDRVTTAQRRLYTRLSDDQIVWMSQTPPTLLSSNIGHFVHEVDLDWRDVIAVVDGLVWNHIIGVDQRYIPPEEHSQLRTAAGQRDLENYEGALRETEDEYLSRRLPRDLWEGLCRQSIEYPSDQLLVKFPLDHSAVTAVHEVTREMATSEPFGTLPGIRTPQRQ
jgi:hypothetical protein